MQLEDLIIRLRIKEDKCGSKRKLRNQTIESRANVVEQKFNKKKMKQYSQGSLMGPKGSISKKFKGRCFVCDKSGHRPKDCRKGNDQENFSKKAAQANMIETNCLSEDVS